MKLAIMQPYFFPYLGYWQLIHAVDRFVIYDDVNFIKNGWINRNRILVNGQPVWVTVPLRHASQNKRICDLELDVSGFRRERLLKTVTQAYRRTPCFDDAYPVIEAVVENPESRLASFLESAIRSICEWIGIGSELVSTSRSYENSQLQGAARILDICAKEKASMYVNAPGGTELYDAVAFRAQGTELRFIDSRPRPYLQRGTAEFVPHLSIIDAMMELGAGGIRSRLDEYDLVSAGASDGR